MLRPATWVTALSVVVLPIAVHASGPHGVIEVGNWKGGAYLSDATGQFSHCAAGTSYNSGIYFVVGIAANAQWSLAFAHRDWQLKRGETIPIQLTFDGRAPFHAFGTVLTTIGAVVQMPPNSDLIQQFRKSRTMVAFARGQAFPFSLDTTSQLLPALAACVTQANGGISLNAINIRTPTGETRQLAQPPPISSLRPERPAGVSAEYQVEAIQLASNFILKTHLQNARVLNRSETPVEFVSYGAAWKSDEAQGAVRIIAAPGNVKGIDIAAAVAAGDSKECKGKFASGRVSELVDSDVVFRGFATCKDSGGSRVAQYFIIPRTKGGFVLFSVVSDLAAEPAKNVIKDEKIVDFQRAALTTANQ